MTAATTDPTDLTPAPDTVGGVMGKTFNAAQLITMASHAVANTVFVPPTPEPAWYGDLHGKLEVATGLAREWITEIDPEVSSRIPGLVLDYGATFTATVEAIRDLAAANPGARGADDGVVAQVREILEQTLVPGVSAARVEIDALTSRLTDWGTRAQRAHDDLHQGINTVQSAENSLTAEIATMNSAIDGLHQKIRAENDAIAASAVAVAAGLVLIVAGVALAPETGGASLVVSVVGVAAVAGGGATWGVMQARIDEQYGAIADDQSTIASDQRQIIALRGLATGTTATVSSLESATAALSKLDTQWRVLQDELTQVIEQLTKAEAAVSVILENVFTQAARHDWQHATDTATALVNAPVAVESRTLPMKAA